MDLQVAEYQGELQQCVDVCRVEHRDAVSASEHQTAVRQLTRSTVHELVACQSVGLIERGDASCLDIQTVQSFHRTDPEVSLVAFLDAGHIGTGEACNARHLVGLEVIAQQAVAYGAYPHVALLVLMHVGGNKHTAADTLLHVWNLQLRQLARRGIHPCDILIEGGDEHLAVAELQQRGYEGIIHVERLLCDGLTAVGTEAEDVGGARCHPHRTVIRLFEVHGHRYGPLAEDAQPLSVVSALHHDVGGREPQQSVTVAEDVVHGILRLSGGQAFDNHRLCLLRVAVIHEHTLRHGRDPQVLLFVYRHGHD